MNKVATTDETKTRYVTKTSAFAIIASVAIGAGIAAAGNVGSIEVGSIPIFGLCIFIAFAINIAVFVPSFVARTEHYFDLTGSITYLTVIGLGLALNNQRDTRAIIVAALVTVWALRLGSFLFLRVKADGGDGRFDKLKTNFWLFLRTWVMQGLWVSLTLACALAVLTTDDPVDFGALGWVGLVIWIVGFGVEVTADRQKRQFKSDPANQGRFISSGIWAWSRHPNYFGEIMLWAGIAVMALPVLSGWRYVMLISPVFVYLLLTKVSGIPLLERIGKKRWGDGEAYQRYLATTPALMMRPPRK